MLKREAKLDQPPGQERLAENSCTALVYGLPIAPPVAGFDAYQVSWYTSCTFPSNPPFPWPHAHRLGSLSADCKSPLPTPSSFPCILPPWAFHSFFPLSASFPSLLYFLFPASRMLPSLSPINSAALPVAPFPSLIPKLQLLQCPAANCGARD